MGFCSAPVKALTAESAEFAKDFLSVDLDFLDAASLDEVFAGSTLRVGCLGFLLFFFLSALRGCGCPTSRGFREVGLSLRHLRG
jgi:hypothetical protein